MARWPIGLPLRLAGRAGGLAWRSNARIGASGQSIFLSSRGIVSLSTVLEKAENVLPCYAMIQQQLGAQVGETSQRLEETKDFSHSSTWSWNGKELVMQGQGRSKKEAKNHAARQVLSALVSEEDELMDPSRNAMLAQWAIQWLNRRLEASMEVQEETIEDGPEGLELDGDHAVQSQVDASHSCVWSCPQLPGETVAHGRASSAAESRRQLMASLYSELPSSLDVIIRNLPAKQEVQQRRGKNQEANLGKINVMHNEVCQQLSIKKSHTYSALANGTHECTLRWSFYDPEQLAQRSEEVTATAKSKQGSKGQANQAMLIKQGHLPDLDDEFHREVADMRQASEDGLVSDVVPRATALMERIAPNVSTFIFFLPEVLRAVLAEDDYGGLSELLTTLRRCLGDEGIPIDLWEELLDESSFSMRHYHLANSALTQLSSFPLALGAFPGEQERQYFKKFRHLLALERHGGLLHGIQQYELDPRMFCSVPLVDVHKMEADKVVLTAIEGGAQDLADGSRPLRNSDLILLVPLEAVDDLSGAEALPEGGYQRSANWQHPGAWLASVTNVKGDSRDSRGSEDVRVHTRRISRFASDVHGATEADGPQLTAPIAPGRQYRLFHIAMETPTARMLGALRCLCRVQLPAWSENFEGRKPSFHFSDGLRQVMLGGPEDVHTQAVQAPRSAMGVASSDQILERLVSPGDSFASLTPTQRRAVQRAMDEQLSIIQGPPGTGKTHVACAVIAGWVDRYARSGERILAVADSNVAADNMYRRLENFGIQNVVRVGQGKDVETLMGDELWHAVKTAHVIIATCIGSGMEMLESRGGVKYFHRVVIDECTQACEPAALVALGRSAEQAVLIGDHNQLPATVLSRAAKDEGLGISLFERMVLTNGLSPTLLIEQRRMHSSIAEFPNMTFYNSQLVNAIEDSSLPPVPGFPWPNPDCRVCFVDVAGSEQKRGYSAYNSAEAAAVAEGVAQMFEAGVPTHELVVLTAYLAQRDEIRRAISNRNMWQAQLNLSIDTIDGYQGMERDIVIFSAARSNSEHTLGFLADARRMNVMLTRARRGIIVFGNGDMLRQSKDTGSHWGAWLSWVESKGGVISAANLTQRQSIATTPLSPASFGSTPYAAPAAAATGGAFTDMPLFGGPTSSAPPPPPLPQNEWQKVYSEEYSRHYYWNTATQQTQWETPPGL